ncbi:MAG TPA: HRDC domain-containing protein, partial [Terricaulis sp.]|nr:HRDC domain-containing protein [Terricaulis sp.]
AKRGGKKEARAGKGAAKAGLSGADAQLFEALRTWRRDTARAADVPPYVVFSDATLAAIAQSKPQDFVALGRVPGIGEAKLKRYGADVLAITIAGV